MRQKTTQKQEESQRQPSASERQRSPQPVPGLSADAANFAPRAGASGWQQALLRHVQRTIGNGAFVAHHPLRPAPPTLLQRDNGGGSSGGGTGGGGGGAGHPAPTEQPYTVSGATLDEVSPQLNHFDGQYAALTQSDLGISGQITPERLEDGTYRATVPWAINGVTVNLPQWSDQGSACAAAQQEWDRFMRQTRLHEQTAHVDASYDFVSNLPEEDRIITGSTRDELVQNIQAKQQALAGRLQGIHDGCDHGASIDAILHPDNGRCEEAESESEVTE